MTTMTTMTMAMMPRYYCGGIIAATTERFGVPPLSLSLAGDRAATFEFE